jgi:GT2 family glycosyltransferase
MQESLNSTTKPLMIDEREMKVTAVIVHYNNRTEAISCVRAVLIQTHHVNEIIVIDNSESIEEKAQFRSRLQAETGTLIRYVETNENIGSAGGFALGMELAVLSNTDWVWIIDQDAIMYPDCLERLLECYRKMGVGIFTPITISQFNQSISGLYLGFWGRSIAAKKNGFDYSSPDTAPSQGLLINKEIIENIGVYNNSMCFVGAEDLEYCLRAKRFGYKLYCVSKAFCLHPDWNKKNNHINLNIPQILKYLTPMNLSGTKRGDARSFRLCTALTCMNYLYLPKWKALVNEFSSFLFMVERYLRKNENSFHETVSAYREGRAMARRSKYRYRIGATELSRFVQTRG